MNLKLNIFFVLMFAAATPSYAGYSKSCLDLCFKTGHDCKYCNYQCYFEEPYYPTPNYSGDSVCPPSFDGDIKRY